MTEHTHTSVTCDGPTCYRGFRGPGSYAGSASEAVADGWIERDGKHYCPECAKELGNG